ncbi:PREDICTED: uncharacterized protein C20orf144 homolog [Chrysochloris asiatica]|uniref:Uncharacterized protein C20orf144 homolog n=1 Tax=Chrysochloris asiatica TaxID=185453 RepID=A0A9B0TE22_CHRAS|nr:PREDICTED: uncharacterized protein C20orf144 homolog [Chrysochloris asiatica]
MGNISCHKRTKMPKQAKEKPLDVDTAWQKQDFSSNYSKKKKSIVVLNTRLAGTKIVIVSLDKRQPRAEATADPGARARKSAEDATHPPRGSPVPPPMLRGAGDSGERREGARAREMKKILLLLLLQDTRLQGEGRRTAGGGAGASTGSGNATNAEQSWQRLYTRLLSESQDDWAEEQPRKRRRGPHRRP